MKFQINKTVILLFVFLILTGCEEPKIISQGVPFQREDTVSCHHIGYCFNCFGNKGCGFSLSALCPGTRKVLRSITPLVKQYESNGKKFNTEHIEVIKYLTECL